MLRAVVLAVALVSSTAAVAKDEFPSLLHSRKAKALTPELARSRLTVENGALQTEITVHSFKVFREFSGVNAFIDDLTGGPSSESFLRAIVDKETGAAIFQVYQTEDYLVGDSPRFYQANYESPAGVTRVEVLRLANKFEGCGRGIAAGICTSVTHVAFTVDELTLRWAAAQYQPRKGAFWKYRLKSQAGNDRLDGIPDAEISAVLAKVDEVRAQLRK